MKFEIKETVKFMAGETREDASIVNLNYKTDAYEFTKKDGWNAIRFVAEGKKRGTYVFSEKLYHWESFELTITEIETGRVVLKLN